MKKNGIILIGVSFVVGSLATTLDPVNIVMSLYLPAIILGVVGITLVQLGNRKEQSSSENLDNVANLETCLSLIYKKSQHIITESEKINVYDLAEYIDRTFRDDIEMFVESRKSISYAYGVQNYANVMSQFAAAERYLNRVWSASVDGYVDEVATYLKKSSEQFGSAYQALQEIRQENAS